MSTHPPMVSAETTRVAFPRSPTRVALSRLPVMLWRNQAPSYSFAQFRPNPDIPESSV